MAADGVMHLTPREHLVGHLSRSVSRAAPANAEPGTNKALPFWLVPGARTLPRLEGKLQGKERLGTRSLKRNRVGHPHRALG